MLLVLGLSIVRGTMNDCTFPRYSDNDIISLIRTRLLTGNEAKNLSKSDLFPNVKPEVVQMIFMRALQSVYGIRLEHFYMMPVTFETAYPQIFEGFLPIGNLFINMEKFFPICRINDFQTADIINPKTKRTARFLSGIINFLFFRDSRREVYLEIQSTYKSAVEREQRLQAAIQEATLKLEKLDTIPAEQQAEFKELSQDIQELEQRLNQEYRQKTNELKLTICNLKEEQEQLKSKITKSPEELTNSKERLKQTLEKLKQDKQEVIKKHEEYRDLVGDFPSCQLEMELYEKKLQAQEANVQKLLALSAEIRTLEDQIENSNSRFKNAMTEEMSLKRLVKVKQEKLAATELKIKKICEDMEQRKRAITEYCNTFQEKRGVVCEKLTETHTEIRRLKDCIQQLTDSIAKEKSKAQEIYLSLRGGLEKYHGNLAKIVDSCTSARETKTAELTKLF
ncbi:Kinetochore protein Nuf2 [Varanus komodoensis]|nr:Kinetochore protein Nuf2 [Varanus komodoensis]